MAFPNGVPGGTPRPPFRVSETLLGSSKLQRIEGRNSGAVGDVSRPSSFPSVVTSSGNESCDPIVGLVRGSNPTHPRFAVSRVFPGSPTVVISSDKDSCDRTWVGSGGVGGVSWWDHRTRWFTTRAEPTHARVRLCGGKRKPRRATSETVGGGETTTHGKKKKREMGDPRGKLDARSAAAEKAKVRVRGGRILAS